MNEHTRINLDEELAGRTPIDAGWSRKKKTIVGASAATIASAALAGGIWWSVAHRPPRLPRTADEAVALLASAKFDRLDEDRQRQYSAEAARLMRALPAEQRRALFQDESKRDAMRRLFQERLDDLARRYARGEDPPFPGGPRQGRRGDGERRPPFNRKDMSPEDRAAMRDKMVEQINEQMAQQDKTGNTQDSGLRGEMFKRRAAQGGGRGGGGGGRRGG